MEEARCGNCLFYLPDDSNATGDGLCRRFPPQVIVSADRLKLMSRFPPMDPVKGWCGEHKRRTH